ncbi:MAG: IS982 family transposase, partial [Micromonosporaceae bacterium]
MRVDLDTLATALYVKIDDELKASPQLNRWRPRVGIA